MRELIIITVFFIAVSTTVYSEPPSKEQIEDARMQMLYRIALSAEEYGKEKHIDPEIISYCKSELYRNTSENAANNNTPFSIENDKITTSEQLEKVLAIRESYERLLLKICLKKTENKLHRQR